MKGKIPCGVCSVITTYIVSKERFKDPFPSEEAWLTRTKDLVKPLSPKALARGLGGKQGLRSESTKPFHEGVHLILTQDYILDIIGNISLNFELKRPGSFVRNCLLVHQSEGPRRPLLLLFWWQWLIAKWWSSLWPSYWLCFLWLHPSYALIDVLDLCRQKPWSRIQGFCPRAIFQPSWWAERQPRLLISMAKKAFSCFRPSPVKIVGLNQLRPHQRVRMSLFGVISWPRCPVDLVELLRCWIVFAAKTFFDQYFGNETHGASHPALNVLNRLCTATDRLANNVKSIVLLKGRRKSLI